MATAYKIATAWEDGGPAQVGKAITITSNTGGPVTLYQADGVTTAPNPVTTTLVDATAQVVTYVIAAGRYLLTGADGVQKALQINATVTPDPGGPTLAGPTTFAPGAVGLNGNAPVAKAGAVAAAVATGVVNPANAAYTLADQTALAASVQGLVTSVNAIRAALTAIGITA